MKYLDENNQIKYNDENREQVKQYFLKEQHSICSYLAMFPPHVPREYIEKYTNEGDFVYDPFSGRGTTILEARSLNRKVLGNDLSPLAYVLTKSKSYNLNFNEVIKRVDYWEKKYNEWSKKNEINLKDETFEDFKVFYSYHNLKQLLFLRKNIGEKYLELDEIDNYILSIALGIMHGQTKKNGQSIYFSVNTVNGFSLSPNYAKKYIKEKNLKYIESNVFSQIRNRIQKKRPDFLKYDDSQNKIFIKDALRSSEFINKKPKLIFTSPPYLNLVRYVSQNWIRFWMLGFSKNDTNQKMLDDYHNLNSYKEFLLRFMLEMEKIMDKDTIFIMVIGDVNNKSIFIKDIVEELLPKTNFKYKNNPIKQPLKNKLTRQAGKTRTGRATDDDWVFTLEFK